MFFSYFLQFLFVKDLTNSCRFVSQDDLLVVISKRCVIYFFTKSISNLMPNLSLYAILQ